jgi:hypothetical protein
VNVIVRPVQQASDLGEGQSLYGLINTVADQNRYDTPALR